VAGWRERMATDQAKTIYTSTGQELRFFKGLEVER
jgi:hypothetical protein